MGRRQANEDEVAIMVDTGLTHRLTTVEVIPQNGDAAFGKEVVMSLKPTLRRCRFAILLVCPVLRVNEFWHQGNYMRLFRGRNDGQNRRVVIAHPARFVGAMRTLLTVNRLG